MVKKKYSILIFSAFSLKVIAIIAVLFDHVGLIFIPGYQPAYEIFRIIGLLAFVLYSFFIVEGVLKSKKPLRYLLRLLYLYIVLQVFGVVAYVFDNTLNFRNIFMTLLGTASLLVYFHHKLWRKVYLLFPPILLIIFNLFFIYRHHSVLDTFAGDYGFYGFFVIIGYYLAALLANKFITYQATNLGIDPQGLVLTEHGQKVRNLASSISLLFIIFIWYILDVLSVGIGPLGITSWSLLVIPLLLLYSGKLGHNSRVWRSFYYLFFPAHLVIIALIYILI